MIVLASLLSIVLLLMTALHVYWGLGGVWPGRDSASCADTVVGFEGVDEMPSPLACFAVAACLLLATLWPMAVASAFATPFPPAGLAVVALCIALFFFGRGVVGFTPRWRRLTPKKPFAELDVKIYSPLCLLLGCGFLLLAIGGFSA
ncbi:MAG: DUF3995 domain-containing protein [Rhizobiaceae bacterium]|nr:MAG: DUF3995 domain-containing protein [Rhizobiaceae bacterium]